MGVYKYFAYPDLEGRGYNYSPNYTQTNRIGGIQISATLLKGGGISQVGGYSSRKNDFFVGLRSPFLIIYRRVSL